MGSHWMISLPHPSPDRQLNYTNAQFDKFYKLTIIRFCSFSSTTFEHLIRLTAMTLLFFLKIILLTVPKPPLPISPRSVKSSKRKVKDPVG
jgi:hypothetical protein